MVRKLDKICMVCGFDHFLNIILLIIHLLWIFWDLVYYLVPHAATMEIKVDLKLKNPSTMHPTPSDFPRDIIWLCYKTLGIHILRKLDRMLVLT